MKTFKACVRFFYIFQKMKALNPLSVNPTKWSNILFDHFVKLALKVLKNHEK